MSNGYTPTPQHVRTTADTVSVRNPKGRITLGDLRALMIRARGLPDESVVTVAGLVGGLLDNHKYVEDIAVTHQYRETPAIGESIDCA